MQPTAKSTSAAAPHLHGPGTSWTRSLSSQATSYPDGGMVGKLGKPTSGIDICRYQPARAGRANPAQFCNPRFKFFWCHLLLDDMPARPLALPPVRARLWVECEYLGVKVRGRMRSRSATSSSPPIPPLPGKSSRSPCSPAAVGRLYTLSRSLCSLN